MDSCTALSLSSWLVWFHVHATLFLVLHALRTMHDSLFTAFRCGQILQAKMLGFPAYSWTIKIVRLVLEDKKSGLV